MRPIDADALIEFCAERWIPLNIDAVNMQPTIQPEKAQLSREGTTKDATSELISRQATIDALKHNQDVYSHNFHDDPIDKYTTAIIATDIDTLVNLPTIQPEVLACGNGELIAQPEPHKGHWIWVAGELMCSECRTIYSDLYPDYDNAVACPHCGARMKGVSNERTD